MGAIGVRSIAWWEGSVTLASFVNRYQEHGGGDLAAFSWAWDDAPAYARVGEVETLDGFLLVVAPDVVRDIRFDEGLSDFHGYDLDYCLQVREAGRKVMTADFRAIHHRPLEMITEEKPGAGPHGGAEKWDGHMHGIGTGRAPGRPGRDERRPRPTPPGRCLLNRLEGDARVAWLRTALDEARGSISWRATVPLRRGRRA